ncbi:Probable peptidyl-prolyl cis-trans isomerase B [Leucobacter sp. 7(1)]|nr:Probable peptidyl-prolyl cis-trans isomerase B [Leucobacter sp. 7(1)]
MNTLAIIALVGGILFNIVGIICGHIALSQIKRTGERGRGLALAGTIIGYVSLAASIIGMIFMFVIIGVAAQTASTSVSSSLSQLDGATAELESSLPESGDLSLDSATADIERSPEFCAALTTALETESNPNEIEFSPEEIAAYTALAKVDSPHQDVYQKFAEFTKDPAILTSDADFTAVLGDFSSVLFEDSYACA